jgi:anti-repressor protein
MSAVIPFTFETSEVRLTDRDGNVWFVVVDVCRVLELANPRDVASRLDDDEKDAVGIPDTIGREQSTTIISEPGLYKLIATSRKSAAKRFDRWVRHEVLPQIRKTGTYGMPIIDVRNHAQLTTIALQLIEVNTELKAELDAARPKTVFYDKFVDADGRYNLQTGARVLGLGPNKFIQWLKGEGKYLFHQGGGHGALVPYVQHIHRGLFEVKTTIVDGKAYPQTYITPKGIQYFAEKLRVGELTLGSQPPAKPENDGGPAPAADGGAA